MFKRSSVRYGRTPVHETPYQKAAQVWDERIGSARVQASNWRLMAFGCLMLSGGLASGLVWQSIRGTVTPWVVQVDRLGLAQAVAPADGNYQPTDPQIAFHLARFIEDVRGLPADAIVLRQDWLRAYDFTTDRGAAALNDYARTNDPFANLGKLQISRCNQLHRDCLLDCLTMRSGREFSGGHNLCKCAGCSRRVNQCMIDLEAISRATAWLIE
jgi:type IV secretion system protein TrbF